MAFDNQPVEIPQTLPMLPVRDIVVFPYMIIPLFVGREASIRSVEDALAKNRLIFLASQKDISEENPSAETIYKVGTVAKIMRMRKLSDGRVKILIQGEAKAEITSFVKTNGCFEVAVEKLSDVVPTQTAPEIEALIRSAKESIEKMIAYGKALSPDILLVLDDVTDAGRVADLIASNLGIKVAEAQKVLETRNPIERLSLVNQILMAELEVLQAQAKIRGQGRGDDQKNQRENFCASK
jgi:ATP-dependent Lon protease